MTSNSEPTTNFPGLNNICFVLQLFVLISFKKGLRQQMDIYAKKSTWKFLLLTVAVIIVVASLWYTNILAAKLADEERKKVKLISNAYKQINNADENSDISMMFEVIKDNKTVPVILTSSEGIILAYRNLDSIRAVQNKGYLQRILVEMKTAKEPIPIEIAPGQRNFIYYKDSYLLTQLRYYPFFQFGIIGIFLGITYLAFSTARKAEQNQVWVGMAKETAHQIGTPLSSLLAWIEHLKETDAGNEKSLKIVKEMEKDVSRFELIADRFSKIGSTPDKSENDIKETIERSIAYVKRRASEKVTFSVNIDSDQPVMVYLNPPLFDWVIENLLKNALDAMDGVGEIKVDMQNDKRRIIIDVIDSGKGMPKSKFNTVFQPGYSTKRRGWGLGLSLSKRIIESYHSGKIFVKDSVTGKSTTFRIILPKA